jgi:hypothetical protein
MKKHTYRLRFLALIEDMEQGSIETAGELSKERVALILGCSEKHAERLISEWLKGKLKTTSQRLWG